MPGKPVCPQHLVWVWSYGGWKCPQRCRKLSDGTPVAGIHRYLLASFATQGKCVSATPKGCGTIDRGQQGASQLHFNSLLIWGRCSALSCAAAALLFWKSWPVFFLFTSGSAAAAPCCSVSIDLISSTTLALMPSTFFILDVGSFESDIKNRDHVKQVICARIWFFSQVC